MKLIRELRLIPIVLFATVCLLSLKVLGLIADDRVPLADIDFQSSSVDKTVPGAARGIGPGPASERTTRRAKGSWAKEMFNFPDVTGSIAAEKTTEKNAEENGDKKDKEKAGEKGDKKNADKPGAPQELMPAGIGGRLVPLNQGPPVPPGERALLERLQERREELDTRARELEIRENLLKAAEQQLEIRMGELKELETRLQQASQRKNDSETLKFKSLVTMYENMRAKDAAKIFDRLDLPVLLDVASQINPRRMSDILAQMDPKSAEQLTVALANRANATTDPPAPKELPKIEGKPRS
ncbi:MAG: flagellar protein FlbB [Xanthobacteraceae bacterium]